MRRARRQPAAGLKVYFVWEPLGGETLESAHVVRAHDFEGAAEGYFGRRYRDVHPEKTCYEVVAREEGTDKDVRIVVEVEQEPVFFATVKAS